MFFIFSSLFPFAKLNLTSPPPVILFFFTCSCYLLPFWKSGSLLFSAFTRFSCMLWLYYSCLVATDQCDKYKITFYVWGTSILFYVWVLSLYSKLIMKPWRVLFSIYSIWNFSLFKVIQYTYKSYSNSAADDQMLIECH